MRYRLSHRTSYTYKSSVDLAHHLPICGCANFPASMSSPPRSSLTRGRSW